MVNYSFINQLRLARLKRKLLRRYRMLSVGEVDHLLGIELSDVPNTVLSSVILVLDHCGNLLAPEFQFDRSSKRVKPVVTELIRMFREARPGALPSESTIEQIHRHRYWEIFIWLNSECEDLDGRVPLKLLDTNPDKVLKAARQELEPAEF